jgi:hypothetical protein
MSDRFVGPFNPSKRTPGIGGQQFLLIHDAPDAFLAPIDIHPLEGCLERSRPPQYRVRAIDGGTISVCFGILEPKRFRKFKGLPKAEARKRTEARLLKTLEYWQGN